MKLTRVEPSARQLNTGLSSSQPQKGILSNLLDLIFPPRCAGCNRVDFEWCPRCSQQITSLSLHLHHRKLVGMHISSTGIHEGILQSAVQALKYENLTSLTNSLADRLYNGYIQLNWKPDLIVPIPMHINRLQQRGYNQAELLASALAEKVHLPCDTAILSRHRDTPSQVGLSRKQRINNVKGAFRVNGAINGASILLVDDVFTTGATIAMCGQALLKAGAHQVFGLTVTTAQS